MTLLLFIVILEKTKGLFQLSFLRKNKHMNLLFCASISLSSAPSSFVVCHHLSLLLMQHNQYLKQKQVALASFILLLHSYSVLHNPQQSETYQNQLSISLQKLQQMSATRVEYVNNRYLVFRQWTGFLMYLFPPETKSKNIYFGLNNPLCTT